MTARKHASCIAHPKLGCGCKVCETPASTAHNDMAGLVEFHAYIHSIIAARAERVRLVGSGQTIEPRAWTPAGYVMFRELVAANGYRTSAIAATRS